MTFQDFPNLIFQTTQISHGNMSLTKGSEEEALHNRQQFFESLGVNRNNIFFLSLELKDKVLIVDKSIQNHKLPDADAATTDLKNTFLFMTTADCLPIGIYDPENQIVALVHAGWQGLDTNIIHKTIQKMKIEYKSDPSKLVIEIGPSIGPCCYELFYPKENWDWHPLMTRYEADPKWAKYINKEENKYTIDLWNFAKDQLVSEGIKHDNINHAAECTYHSENYYSHRQSKAEHLTNDYHIATILGIRFEAS